MGRLDYLITDRRSSGGQHRTSGWKGRGLFFWVVLILMIYWFILKPMGFTLTKNW